MKNSKRLFIWIFIFLLGVYALFFSPGAVQRRELNKSKEDMVKIGEKIKEDKRFSEINFRRSTDWHQPLVVKGKVQSKKDLEDFQKIMLGLEFQGKVSFEIQIIDEEAKAQ